MSVLIFCRFSRCNLCVNDTFETRCNGDNVEVEYRQVEPRYAVLALESFGVCAPKRLRQIVVTGTKLKIGGDGWDGRCGRRID